MDGLTTYGFLVVSSSRFDSHKMTDFPAVSKATKKLSCILIPFIRLDPAYKALNPKLAIPLPYGSIQLQYVINKSTFRFLYFS